MCGERKQRRMKREGEEQCKERREKRVGGVSVQWKVNESDGKKGVKNVGEK